MEQRYYSKNINVQNIAYDLQRYFSAQGYDAQILGVAPNVLFQIRKKDFLRAVTGMQRAMSAQFRETDDNIVVTLGEQEWADKAAVGAIGAIIFAPLLLTAAYGAYQQSQLPQEIWRIVDSHAMQVGAAYTVPQQPIQPPPPPVNAQTAPPPTNAQTAPPPPAPAEAQPVQSTEPVQTTEPVQHKHCPDCGAEQIGSKHCPECGRKN